MKTFIRQTLLLLGLLIGSSGWLLAQTDRTVTGTVVGENGEAVPGTSILVKGTTTGTTTDVKGEFSLRVPASEYHAGVLLRGHDGPGSCTW